MEITYDILFLILKQSPFHTLALKQTSQSFLIFLPWKKARIFKNQQESKRHLGMSVAFTCKGLCLKAENTLQSQRETHWCAALLFLSHYFQRPEPQPKHSN